MVAQSAAAQTSTLMYHKSKHSAFNMTRWVRVNDNKIEFGNIVGGFVGAGYRYECAEAIDAFAFGKFLEKRDPENDDLPIAVTYDDLVRFNAKLIV